MQSNSKLIQASKKSALLALKIFNDPIIYFKYESYLMLMMVAWTYLMHDYLKGKGVDVRYYKLNRNRELERTKDGSVKFWELERCLKDEACPLSKNSINLLIKLLRLRHEVEHQMTEKNLSQKHQLFKTCFLEYNQFLKQHYQIHEFDQLMKSLITYQDITWSDEDELNDNTTNYTYGYLHLVS